MSFISPKASPSIPSVSESVVSYDKENDNSDKTEFSELSGNKIEEIIDCRLESIRSELLELQKLPWEVRKLKERASVLENENETKSLTIKALEEKIDKMALELEINRPKQKMIALTITILKALLVIYL
ncbi:Oidioi.mRNA.OKI2018_I69.PAR.g9680.t1.cds [Oikopleura dioica]|uniref:Oidioi.mRNA.OKI2018_I69.PAR.g9680.t1.cds n=1 Tax=Oikopleura dioica TaxID=34765 RepID=A0ABN7RLN2_OIKDI|nr:Oidioi.mRNA.OKI2018_I69.PAR.g9680.t1.cds [Oikopleura dioica]